MKPASKIQTIVFILALVFALDGAALADDVCPKDTMRSGAQCTRPVNVNIGCEIWDMSYTYREKGYRVVSIGDMADTSFSYQLSWTGSSGKQKS